tara:strand:- start:2256 stop:3341 length:1086 start_codon:yes stop_codon:yes gene_type:complete
MKIAIFGAGQLAMMMIQGDHANHHDYVVIDPTTNPPASRYGKHIQTEYDDEDTLKRISDECDLATIDFENVPVEAMRELEKHICVHPNSNALEICQDRLNEKKLFSDLGIRTTMFDKINSLDSLNNSIEDHKSYILKSRRFGYDGKNQYRINPGDRIKTNLISQECILEELVDFESEVSLICVRSIKDEVLFYPLVENKHNDGILSISVCPSNYNDLQSEAEKIGNKLLVSMNYVGVLVIEFFVTSDRKLIANEMAPRVHNSGHWTIEGANISQFQAHINAISGGIEKNQIISYKPSAMFNILSEFVTEDKLCLLKEKYNVHVHDYHKSERMGRKLGHITYTCDKDGQLSEDISAIKKILQ